MSLLLAMTYFKPGSLDVSPPAYEEAISSHIIPFDNPENRYTPSLVQIIPYISEKPQSLPPKRSQSPPPSHEETISSSVDYIPDVKLTDEQWVEDPPIVQAAGKGDTGLVQILLVKGANVNGKSYWGKTALYKAAAKGHVRNNLTAQKIFFLLLLSIFSKTPN